MYCYMSVSRVERLCSHPYTCRCISALILINSCHDNINLSDLEPVVVQTTTGICICVEPVYNNSIKSTLLYSFCPVVVEK